MKVNLEQLEEMQKELFRQQCDLDIQKAMVNHFIKKKKAEQLTLTDVSDIVHRAELKVLENVSDYIPCEIYSQAVISSQKKRDNVR
jgi:hypothetical protein